MKQELSIADLLNATAEQMRVDFQKLDQLRHPGEKGRGREDVLRRFLSEYLPGRFGVDTGFVIDARGETSGQMDVVLYDKASAPVFKLSDNVRVFPVESVAGVVQVKSSLHSRELESAVHNLATASKLDRTAGQQPYSIVAGVMLPALGNLVADVSGRSPSDDADAQGFLVSGEPVLTAIFAFEGDDLDKLAPRLRDLSKDPLTRVPLVCVLNRGVISYFSEGAFGPLCAYWQDSKLAFTFADDAARALHVFYQMVAFGVTRKAPIMPRYGAYTGISESRLHFLE